MKKPYEAEKKKDSDTRAKLRIELPIPPVNSWRCKSSDGRDVRVYKICFPISIPKKDVLNHRGGGGKKKKMSDFFFPPGPQSIFHASN